MCVKHKQESEQESLGKKLSCRLVCMWVRVCVCEGEKQCVCGCLTGRQLDRAHLWQSPSCVLSTTPKRALPITPHADGTAHLPAKPDQTHTQAHVHAQTPAAKSNRSVYAHTLEYTRIHLVVLHARSHHSLLVSFLTHTHTHTHTHTLGAGVTHMERLRHTHTHSRTTVSPSFIAAQELTNKLLSLVAAHLVKGLH